MLVAACNYLPPGYFPCRFFVQEVGKINQSFVLSKEKIAVSSREASKVGDIDRINDQERVEVKLSKLFCTTLNSSFHFNPYDLSFRKAIAASKARK